MAHDTLMDRLRSFLGLRVTPPKNEFRNPIWGSDDDDDGDELYTRHMDAMDHVDVHSHVDLHRELAKHMHDIFSSFGGMFGDMRAFFSDEALDPFGGLRDPAVAAPALDDYNSNSIRDYYLKPGYHRRHDEPKDVDLDGKISSQDISGLFKKNEEGSTQTKTKVPFDGSLVPGHSYCQTIITTSVTKPDGTVETRRIVKNGNEIVEQTTTSTPPEVRGPHNPGLDVVYSTGIIVSELASLFKNFY